MFGTSELFLVNNRSRLTQEIDEGTAIFFVSKKSLRLFFQEIGYILAKANLGNYGAIQIVCASVALATLCDNIYNTKREPSSRQQRWPHRLQISGRRISNERLQSM
jgi:hypothetical protein